MSLSRKCWLLGVVLCWWAVWPLCHAGLVAFAEADPWKLGGLGMYTNHHDLHVTLIDAASGLAIAPASLPADGRQRYARFVQYRSVFGRLWSPDRLAHAVLAARPARPALVVHIERLRIERSSAMVETRAFDYRYGRDDP